MSELTSQMELLAPAGDQESLEAAIATGANAVYLGLHTLNARRGAKNFAAGDLPGIVEAAHKRNVRIFLTLNIDITQPELGQAVRMLKLAADAGVDAVLVRDPGLIHLRAFFPKLEYHFSTQACIANSEDVLAAGELGASRVVLARELSLAEIRACSAASNVETEVFVQGALCFCISGRCLLSSWAGGHSGNRGTCTSPCRVPWTANLQPIGTPLSMKDLTGAPRVNDLASAGVKSLKIEGRLKSARWVGQAVGLFADALKGADSQTLLERAAELGAYAGRQMTSGYFDAQYGDLVASASGRSASTPSTVAPVVPVESAEPQSEPERAPEPKSNTYDLTIDVTDKAIVCTCRLGDRDFQWTMPKTVVHRANKAVSIYQAFNWLQKVPVREYTLGNTSSNSPQFLMVPRAANALPDQISTAIRQLTKPEDATLRQDLPEDLRAVLAKTDRHPANKLELGNAPDRVRLEGHHVAEFVRRVKATGQRALMPASIIIEPDSPEQIERAQIAAAGVPLIVALPPVFFEADIPAIRKLVAFAVAKGLTVEVNTWGGWRIAKQAKAHIEAGPAMGIMNALSAIMLVRHGCETVSIAPELDRKQLERLTAYCPAPSSLTVFGRPALMITRVKLDREQIHEKTLRDRRDVELRVTTEHGLTVLRPVAPFDLRGIKNPSVTAAHLVVDLVGSPSPVEEWLHRPSAGEKHTHPLQFNYGRTLQ